MGKYADIENQLYNEARAVTDKSIIKGTKKVNFDETTKGLNGFEETDAFGRLHPPEKIEIRAAIQQMRKEMSPEARTGKIKMGLEEMEDIIQTGTGEFIGGGGEVRLPGTFTKARATRSWLSEESAKAFKKGDGNLGIAYRNLKDLLERDLKKAVGDNAWEVWKEADAFKTEAEVMKQIFGTKAEVRPGTYDLKKVQANIKKIDRKKLKATFSEDEIKVLDHIGDPGWIAAFQKTHPTISRFIRHITYWGWAAPVAYGIGKSIAGRGVNK